MTIDSFTDAFWFLSNFSPSPLTWQGREWPTVEHAYQAAKNYDPKDWKPVDEAAVEEIRTADTPRLAKKLGRKIQMVDEWEKPLYGREEDEPLKREIMHDLLRLKFENPVLRDALLGTGNAQLIEGNHWGDKIWGVCDGEGTNWLGLGLMKVRTQLRNQHEFPKPTCCEAIQKWPLVYANADEMWTRNDEGMPELVETPTIAWEFKSIDRFLTEFGYDGDPYNMPEPTACPFCATPLPKFRERAQLPEPFCRSDEYYCLTCDERLMGCECLAPQLRWELDQ